MVGALVGTVVVALLFAVFGLLRPADRRPGGCHGCEHEGSGCEGASCTRFADL
jgi:hypothetical protein